MILPSTEVISRILRKCKIEKDQLQTLCTHTFMLRNGLETHISLGNCLISVLLQTKNIQTAKELFEKLVYRNGCSWSSLIIGFVDCGRPCDALKLYRQMHTDISVQPNAHALVALLKACTNLRDTENGIRIHEMILGMGLLDKNPFIASSLISFYAKCGLLARARLVFDGLRCTDIVSWTALITGYVEQGFNEEALSCFEKMQSEGLVSDAAIYVCSLKACANIKAVEQGEEMHADIVRKGWLERNFFLGCALLGMYAACGLLSRAQEVFNDLLNPNVVAWNALIHGYYEHGHDNDVLQCFERMQSLSFSPDEITLACVFQACGSLKVISKGQKMHAQLEGQFVLDLDSDCILSNTLVGMYAKCGRMDLAQEMFDRLSFRDIVTWNTMITGYVEDEKYREAFKYFEQLHFEGISANSVTFICALRACGSMQSIYRGQDVHGEIVRRGLLKTDLAVGNAAIHMYAKCGLLASAQNIFDKIPVRDVVSWTALIAGYTEHSYGKEALKYFRQMQLQGISPSSVSYVCCLKACISVGDVTLGENLHAEIRRHHHSLGGNLDISSALVNMYVHFGLLAKAQQVFDSLPTKNIDIWNALIVAYTEHNEGKAAIKCLKRMQLEGIAMNVVTYVWGLKGCVIVRSLDMVLEIHAEIQELRLEGDPSIASTLIGIYSEFGLLPKAKEVFDKVQCPDVVVWTALIDAYAENEHGKEALKCLEKMQDEDNIVPNAVTFMCSLKACASIGAVVKGASMHAEIERTGFLERDALVGNMLVDMYARSGLPDKAYEVCEKLPERNAVSWTSVMVGYTQVGAIENVVCVLERMRKEDIKPDPITFVVILNACSRVCCLEKSQTFFEAMSQDYGISPAPEHHNCMVDLLSRLGQIDKALKFTQDMPCSSDLIVWHTLLRACQSLGNLDVGKQAFQNVIDFHGKL